MSAPGSDIRKITVMDDRILQTRQSYAVEKGGTAVTNQPVRANSESQSQIQFQLQVPSEQVFVDRGASWTGTYYLGFSVTTVGAATGVPVVQWGRDFALAPFPLHQAVQTANPVINSTSVPVNTDDVRDVLLRLTDYKGVRMQRTCPTKLSSYASATEEALSINNANAGFNDSADRSEVPNGAYGLVCFVDPNNGAALPDGGSGSYTFNGITVQFVDGIPQIDVASKTYPIAVRFTSTEKLLASPFVFNDSHQWDTGLFGIQNIQLTLNLKSPGRCLRFADVDGTRTFTAPTFLTGAPGNGPVQGNFLNVNIISPSLEIPLPPKSCVPYMNYPRYLLNVSTPVAANDPTQLTPAATTIKSQTITLNRVPDLLIVAVKLQSYGPTDQDYYLPVNAVRINFDNIAGLMSTATREQLFQISQHNGVEQSYEEWTGLARHSTLGYFATTGGLLVLKPGTDFALSTGLAPGVTGNFTLQLDVDVYNWTGVSQNAQLVIITPESGYFESVRGSSRVVTGLLSAQDVLSSEDSDVITRMEAKRAIGGMVMGGGILDSLPTMISRAKGMFDKLKPAISAVKDVAKSIDHPSAKKAASLMESVGLGGGASRRGLAARLM